MQPSLEKLRKFFRLEHQNGYDDTAIIGGLAKMLDFWESEARGDGIEEEIIQAVVQRLKSYASLSPQSRADALKGLWKRIGERYPEATQKRATRAPRSQPKPASGKRKSISAEAAPSAPQKRRTAPPPGRAETVPGGVTSATPAALGAELTVLQGVGPRHAQTLSKLGLRTLGDMLYYFPRRYEDYSQLKPIRELFYGQHVTVIGAVQSVHSRPIRGGKAQLVEAILSDGTGALRLSWFNQPWMVNRLHTGDAIAVSGKIEQYLGRLVMNNPDFEPVEAESLHTNRIVPIYSLTEKITQKWLRGLMNQVVTYWAPRLADHLPEGVRQAANLLPLGEALLQAHFPDSQDKLKAARQRLAFDEIFFLQMGVLRQKRDWQSVTARIFDVPEEWMEARLQALPFQLTNAQQRALDDILVDLGSGRPMNRLLQGDVGSGKTVVAALAAAIVANAGAQAAVMAPTSILAEQHFRNFSHLLAGENGILPQAAIRLLIGDTPEAEKEAVRVGLQDGSVKVVIGTHALLEEPVQFADLELAVIDEQHRFGVEQRSALRAKGRTPHLLVMTATPIPRSLALTLYGDLDLSVMDEMPAGRQPVSTYVLRPQERERAYTLIRSQVRSGRQAFIIYPLIEESDKIEARAAVDDHQRLSQEIFPDLKLGLLHGRMRPDEKEAVMRRFRDREFDILVSTTVVEVGVDVPNATVMLVEDADRFGLAQLHQLRGRVGRGAEQSYCLLIPSHEDAVENERLQAMAESNDGFVLAERDLQQRGPGEFLGTRQSGYASGLRMASLTDVDLIERARSQAQQLFEQDARLEAPENALLAEALERFWGDGKGDVS
ncbi:MAG: ATP-dependent DNA helicase RecG [Anaerolineales bacterium]